MIIPRNKLCTFHLTIIYIYIYSAIFCHVTSLKKTIWPRGDSNLRRRSQSTDLCYGLDHHASPKKLFKIHFKQFKLHYYVLFLFCHKPVIWRY